MDRSRRDTRLAWTGLVAWAFVLVAAFPHLASATFVHDHSDTALPLRPDGLTQLNDMFGPRCDETVDKATRVYWPSQNSGGGGYVYSHALLARAIAYDVRGHVDDDHRNPAVNVGVFGYDCRLISGSTSWSVHSWGAAVDTNSATNPMGQSKWDGTGSNGTDYGKYLPDVWRGADPGHRFYWGLNFTRPDPMHFQYVTNY